MIAVGLVPQFYKLDHQPGWLPHSVAFHADDGKYVTKIASLYMYFRLNMFSLILYVTWRCSRITSDSMKCCTPHVWFVQAHTIFPISQISTWTLKQVLFVVIIPPVHTGHILNVLSMSVNAEFTQDEFGKVLTEETCIFKVQFSETVTTFSFVSQCESHSDI